MRILKEIGRTLYLALSTAMGFSLDDKLGQQKKMDFYYALQKRKK